MTETKRDLLAEDPSRVKEYQPFVVNRSLSYYSDCVLFADELNRFRDVDADMQYAYLLHSLRPRRRFARWHKPEREEAVDLVTEYYGYSRRKAEEAARVLTPKQVDRMRQILDKGGPQ